MLSSWEASDKGTAATFANVFPHSPRDLSGQTKYIYFHTQLPEVSRIYSPVIYNNNISSKGMSVSTTTSFFKKVKHFSNI